MTIQRRQAAAEWRSATGTLARGTKRKHGEHSFGAVLEALEPG